MGKLDLTKTEKSYYAAKPKPELVVLKPAEYLSIERKGDPSSADFATSIQALYSTAYTVKFTCKDLGSDFVVPKLEGLWWFDEERYSGLTPEDAPKKVPRSEWSYRLLIRMPDFVTSEMVSAAKKAAVDKKGIAEAGKVAYLQMDEGKVVQMLHVGPFDREPETLAVMMAFMTEHQLKRNGLHHEIYLSDFRKTSPEKLRTILREPVK